MRSARGARQAQTTCRAVNNAADSAEPSPGLNTSGTHSDIVSAHTAIPHIVAADFPISDVTLSVTSSTVDPEDRHV